VQDPERFLDEGTDFERALLRGGKVERPTARVVRRMAIGAGVGGALSYTSSAKALMQSWWGKTMAVALVGGGVAMGVAGALAPPEAQAPSAAGSNRLPARASEAALPAAPRMEEPAGSVPALEPAADPEPPPRMEARAAAAPKPSGRAKSASTLADEVKLLDRVRALMARGDQTSALRELDGYDQRYPEGTLRREARVLRARANDAP